MRGLCLWVSLLLAAAIFASGTSATDALGGGFVNRAKFSVDQQATSASAAVATMDPRTGATGYSWVRIYFYRDGPTSTQRPVTNKTIPAKNWDAALLISVDCRFAVGQVNMAIPGHACTIASEGDEVKNFLQVYRFDGKHLRLKSKGTHLCDLSFMNVPNQMYRWDVDFSTPVLQKGAS